MEAKEALTRGVLPHNRQNDIGHVRPAVRAHDGDIVPTREIHSKTAHPLEDAIVGLRRDCFRFATVGDAGFASSMRQAALPQVSQP